MSDTVTKVTLPDNSIETRDSSNRLHSVDNEPAVVYADGLQMWYHHGKCHRGDGLASVIYPNGDREYWQHGKLMCRFTAPKTK